MTLVSFSLGNIIGTEIFQPKDAPAYISGKVAILVTLTVQLGICYILRWINGRMNAQKRTRLAEEKARRGWTDEEVQKERERHAFMDLTDKQYVPTHLRACLGTDAPPGTCTSCTLCEPGRADCPVSNSEDAMLTTGAEFKT